MSWKLKARETRLLIYLLVLLGVAVVLIVSSWRRSRLGLWVSLLCAAVLLLWVTGAILGSLFE